MKIWIIDEDENNRTQIRRHFESDDVRCFDIIYDAYSAEGKCDIAIIDISALSAGMTDLLHHAYSPICGFIKKHPGAAVVICSGFTEEQCQETIDIVKEMTDVQVKYWDGIRPFKELSVI